MSTKDKNLLKKFLKISSKTKNILLKS